MVTPTPPTDATPDLRIELERLREELIEETRQCARGGGLYGEWYSALDAYTQAACEAYAAGERERMYRDGICKKCQSLAAERDQARAQNRELVAALRAYEQWEANLIMENAAWASGHGFPELTAAVWDELMDCQTQRNSALQYAAQGGAATQEGG